MQSHKCVYLQGDQCRADEHCQYKLTSDQDRFRIFCGKDQIVELIRLGVLR